MAKIFLAPKGIDPPKIESYIKTNSINEYFKACDEYVKQLSRALKLIYGHVCKEAGETISFPVADGRAIYVVARLKPVELVWVESGDAWQFQYAHRLTATDVREEIRKTRSLKALFKTKGV
jgi:hypothetical protein